MARKPRGPRQAASLSGEGEPGSAGAGGLLRSLRDRGRGSGGKGAGASAGRARDDDGHLKRERMRPRTPTEAPEEDGGRREQDGQEIRVGAVSPPAVLSGKQDEDAEDDAYLCLAASSLDRHDKVVKEEIATSAGHDGDGAGNATTGMQPPSPLPPPIPQIGSERPPEVETDGATAAAEDDAIADDDADDADHSFLTDPFSQALAQNFVMEHRIFLRAILQLLTERDQFAVEADVNDPHTIKSGPLRKASHLMRGIWKTKYVEIRRGLFSYYDDLASSASGTLGPAGSADAGDVSPRSGGAATAGGGGASAADAGGGDDGPAPALTRKSIPLRASTCTCRAVKVQHKALSPGGAVFEVIVEGGPRRLWMANSREERQAWIHAIHEAMIGKSVTRGDNFLEYQTEQRQRGAGTVGRIPQRSPYRTDLEQYLQVKAQVKKAQTREAYLGALSVLMGNVGRPCRSLNVPVQWIKEQVEVSSAANADKAFLEEGVAGGVAQLWKDMQRDSVSINGTVYKGDAGHGPERIVGALTQTVMAHDRTAPQNVDVNAAFRRKYGITEAQALSYARDVLLACNRTRSGGDSYYCVDNLCSNQDLVVLCPSTAEAEPLNIVVRHTSAEEQHMPGRKGSMGHSGNDMSGWIMMRSKGNKPWKRRFGVLSEGVLSYYEQAVPRPLGLRGQLLISGASMGVSPVGPGGEAERGGAADGEDGRDAAREAEEVAAAGARAGAVAGASAAAAPPPRNNPPASRYIACIVAKDSSGRTKERQLRFDDHMTFLQWNQALRTGIRQQRSVRRRQGGAPTPPAVAAVAKGGGQPQSLRPAPGGSDVRPPRRRYSVPQPLSADRIDPSPRARSGGAVPDVATLVGGSGTGGGVPGARLANQLRERVRSARSGSSSNLPPPSESDTPRFSGEGARGNSGPPGNGAMAMEAPASEAGGTALPPKPALEGRKRSTAAWNNKVKGGRARSTVEIAVRATAVYKVCTTDPQGIESEDTWAMLQTNFLQNFRLSGGPNGRIMRGEEIVQMNFLEGLVPDDAFKHAFKLVPEKSADVPRRMLRYVSAKYI